MDYALLLKDGGLKATKQRVRLLEVLLNAKQPLSAEALFDLCARDGKTPFSTLYRALSAFEQATLVERIDGGDRALYALRGRMPCCVLVCSNCGGRFPVHIEALHEGLARAERDSGFHITGHKVELCGVCAACSASERIHP